MVEKPNKMEKQAQEVAQQGLRQNAFEVVSVPSGR